MTQEAYKLIFNGEEMTTIFQLADAMSPTRCRNFAITARGYYALVPTSARKGDRIAIFDVRSIA